jgi:succinate dehydrogenase / fumarate reductase, membrane anchor subunit
VVTPDRIVVGAHYGWRDWLVQRFTAVLMIIYTLVVLALLLWFGGLEFGAWKAAFSSVAFRIATFVFMLALFWHAWVGMRNILMDYVKPVMIRLALQVLVIGALVGYTGWTIQILWGAH